MKVGPAPIQCPNIDISQNFLRFFCIFLFHLFPILGEGDPEPLNSPSDRLVASLWILSLQFSICACPTFAIMEERVPMGCVNVQSYTPGSIVKVCG